MHFSQPPSLWPIVDAIPYLALGLQVLGAFSIATAISRVLSFSFSTFARPGISLKRFGAKKGAWAVVTGASDGIGREFSIQLAKAGFNVLLAARNQSKLDAVVAEIAKAGSDVQTNTFVIDFASADDKRWDALLEVLKPIEVGVLVNNVGVSHEFPTDFVDTSPEELTTIVDVNVSATLRITSLIAPSMASRKKGLILNIGSFAGAAPTPMLAVYSGSKAFLRTWSDALAAEMAPKGVVVEHVNTYFVTSAMSKIRRASLFIPTPKAFVRAVLAKLEPGTVTPYWTHALVSAVMTLAPPKAVLAWTHSLQKDIRRRALAKQARLAKQE
ncbi:3-ketoacyl-CoA reductase [Multifurca ochricompacta]|uniref:Very-long-chain 3-oxoacyl-CoA reductase n=1 Tax=Multifurca ochricompacta TaxID=376703 RepID=A0AAD4QKG7_9AGAM|nr:3-ketoacyl-CoA reductase [Multifurca ochricompacta]